MVLVGFFDVVCVVDVEFFQLFLYCDVYVLLDLCVVLQCQFVGSLQCDVGVMVEYFFFLVFVEVVLKDLGGFVDLGVCFGGDEYQVVVDGLVDGFGVQLGFE